MSILHGILLWTNLTNAMSVFIIFSHGATTPSGPRRPHNRGFTITLRHITLGTNPLDKWSTPRWDHYLTTHNTHNRQTSMLPAGFETEIPARERRKTHALEGAATRIVFCYYSPNKCRRVIWIQSYTSCSRDKTKKAGMGNVIGFLRGLIPFFWLQLVLLHFLVHQA